MNDRGVPGAPDKVHRERLVDLEREIERARRSSLKLSMARLASFLAAAILLIGGTASSDVTWLALGAVAAALFVSGVAYHARLAAALAHLEARRAVHERHLARIEGRYLTELDPGPECPPGHPYARDVDLFGYGSLAHRIDVSHTTRGAHALVAMLGEAAPRETIVARQEAVEELARARGFREEFEAHAASRAMPAPKKGARPKRERLDPEPFLRFARGEESVAIPSWTRAYALFAPPILLALFLGAKLGHLPDLAWIVALSAQLAVATLHGARCRALFDLVSARKGALESYFAMWRLVEETTFEASLLGALRLRAFPAGEKPSLVTRELERWVSRAELRHQFPVHFVVDVLLLWDLHVAHGLSRYRERTGEGYDAAFSALGELEALCSLATLRAIEPGSTYPEIDDDGAAFVAEGLEHPLLPRESRVANDVRLAGPGAALIVTGSNMAGKSTLLRSTGLAIALGQAGGPVLARRLSMPPLRLRASMRIDDDLQRGASYYHAELSRIRSVIADAAASPRIFFLLDELLRGTNAEARHRGARAILEHLLDRGAYGLVATHDVALTTLAEERQRVENAHFTDVIRDGVMVFDYALRQGVVRGSNALRLLREAGIDVEDGPRE
jgi:hypothetical protein